MCGRSSLTKTEQEIEKQFGATFYSDDLERYNPLPNYNIAPTNFTPIISNQNRDKIQWAHWGLIPSWSRNRARSGSMINARKETILEKKSFKTIIESQRCIVILDGYYEWRKIGHKHIVPYRIISKGHKLFSMAGLWDKWIDECGNTVMSYTILTMESPTFMQFIHHRIPAILSKEQEEIWLSNDNSVVDNLSIIQPVSEASIEYYTVSDKVNNVRNNDCSLIKEVGYGDPGEQLSLF